MLTLTAMLACCVVLTMAWLYSNEVARSNALADELGAAKVRTMQLEGELVDVRAELANSCGTLSSTQQQLASRNEELAKVNEELASTLGKLESVEGQLLATTTELTSTADALSTIKKELTESQKKLEKVACELKIERQVLEGVKELGVKHARRSAYVLELLKTTALQRRRWIRAGEQLAQEVGELKGKAATIEAILAMLERIFGRE